MSDPNTENTQQNNENHEKLKVAVVGDIHVHQAAKGKYRDLFSHISDKADLLVLAGDLTDLGLPDEAEILAADLRACTVPVVAVLGNHDHHCSHTDEVRDILCEANVKFLETHPYDYKGVGFVGVKGFAGGFDRHLLGSFGEGLIKEFVNEAIEESLRLENALRSVHTERLMVVLHYAPIVDTVRGEPPEIFPFLGCSRLAETIDRYKVDLVVHGHAHHGSFEGKTPAGIPVYNCSREIMKKRNPDQPYALFDV